jgi:hypothetical protein
MNGREPLEAPPLRSEFLEGCTLAVRGDVVLEYAELIAELLDRVHALPPVPTPDPLRTSETNPSMVVAEAHVFLERVDALYTADQNGDEAAARQLDGMGALELAVTYKVRLEAILSDCTPIPPGVKA